ncbi:carbohydrate ABC transporter permease [[Clostridium] dakarense]|uniref:carbohydrate ABC transporter permease n=1 Tax=Faecalimicrobium dakarense TaxID=1301100 RepID=UPI001FA7FDBC|nr:carbohydrate ABC transporter permease [[Clostridium] dakarense]
MKKSILAILISLVHIIPLYILVGVALKRPDDLSSRWKLPDYLYLDNFNVAIEQGNILKGLGDSSIITFISIVLITIIGAMAAYPLARNATKTNRRVKSFVMGIMMVPPLSIVVPLYSMMADLQATSTYWGIIVILVTFQLPMSVFLYYNFIRSIPKDLDEAASIDGCGPLRTFFKIILPQLTPVTASVVILTGVSCWNDYQFSLYMLQSSNIKTVTQTIASFFSQNSSNMNAAAATALLGILPILIAFIFLQKYFIKGMIDSAIK